MKSRDAVFKFRGVITKEWALAYFYYSATNFIAHSFAVPAKVFFHILLAPDP